MTAAEVARLNSDTRQRAFWYAGGLELSQVQHVFDSIDKAIQSGEPFEEWRKTVKDQLRDDAHAETVFRNATQRSYSAGRWRQMKDPQVLAFRPYLMFDAIHDTRLSPICRRIDPPGGPPTILPADHPFWDSHVPPLHHRCRSGIRSLRKAEAERRGVTNVPPLTDPQDGFGLSPDAAPIWKPDRKKNDPALVDALERKEKKPRAPKKPKAPPPTHDPKHWEKQFEKDFGDAAPTMGWGRAMQERGLDRPVREIREELQRLRKEGFPAKYIGELDAELAQVPDPRRPLRGQLKREEQTFAAALTEHTRTIKPKGKAAVIIEGPAANDPRTDDVRSFFGLLADDSRKLPISRAAVRSGIRAGSNRTWFDGEWGGVWEIDTNDASSVAIHEYAHGIEYADERALKKSLAFIARRTMGEKLRKLRDLKPGFNYAEHELARPDKFFDAYVGKEYSHGYATELNTMGFQALAGDRSYRFEDLAKDPEMLQFLLGQLAGR